MPHGHGTVLSLSTASNMKSPYKSPVIVTSDNNQVTLTVGLIRKKIVHIIKAKVPSVARQFSHRHTAVHVVGQCLVDDMLLQARPCSSQALLQMSNVQYWGISCMTPQSTGIRLLGQWFVVSGIHVGLFDAVLHAVKIVVSFYKVQYEHIKLRCGVLCTCVCFEFPGVWFCQ